MRLSQFLRITIGAVAGLLLLGNSGCGGGSPTQTTTPPAVSVSVKSDKAALGPGGTAALTATVANDSSNAGVTFSKPAGDAGTLTPTGAFTATYTASNFTQAGSVVVTATSKADATKTASQTLTLTLAITVNATADQTDVGPGQTATITAAVANDINGAGVKFSLVSGDGTLTSTGALTATYTAPAHVASDSAVQIKAVSKADTSATPASTTTSLTERAVTIALVASSTTALTPLQGLTLTAASQYDGGAGVTWSLASGAVGTLTPLDSTHAAYSAPDTVAAAAAQNVIATSVADNTRTQTQAVKIAPAAANPEVDATVDSTGVWENLVQFQNDLTRSGVGVPAAVKRCQAGAAPYAGMLVPGAHQPAHADPSVFQSDLLIFHDTQTGHEVWRLDDDPTQTTAMPGPINRQPWDENGSHFEVWSNRAVPDNDGNNNNCSQVNFIFNGNASTVTLVQPTDPSRNSPFLGGFTTGEFLPWDPAKPGIFYIVTWNDNNAAAGSQSALYSVNANNSDDVITPITTLPSPTRRKEIQSYLNNDGLVMVQDTNFTCIGTGAGIPTSPCVEGPTEDTGARPEPPSSPVEWPNIYMVATNPADPSFGQVKYEFSTHFQWAANNPALAATYCSNGLTDTSSRQACHFDGDEYHFHDLYFRRSADDAIVFNFGPRGDVGEDVFFQATPVSAAGITTFPITTPPTVAPIYAWTGVPALQAGGTPYYSHPAFSFDGSLVAYNGQQTFQATVLPGGVLNPTGQYATWIRNQNTGTTLFDVGPELGHAGWDGFDPNYFVFDVTGDVGDSNSYLSQSLYSVNPTGNVDVNTFVSDTILHAPKRPGSSSNNGVTYSPTGPGLLEGPGQSPDATKVMYSLPEHWVSGSPENAYVVVDHRPFPPVLNSASGGGGGVQLSWSPYTPHKETAGYHVYRSDAGKNAFQDVDNGALVTATTFTDATATAGATYDYAVTAQENSGLESSQLSNVFEVTAGAGAGAQIAAQGATKFDTTAPAPPSGLAACLGTATTDGGSVKYLRLNWAASTSADARYYRIYYGDGAAPLLTQSYLIATPPVGSVQWVLWQVDANNPVQLSLTTVDRQDNESAADTLTLAALPAACGN